MANENPTGGERAVPLDLPPEQITILRGFLSSWLEGVREDLKSPQRLQEPDKARQEAQAYERLLVALTLNQIFLPDAAACVAFEPAVEAYDKENNYAEVEANHDALHGLLALLKEGHER
jgi:hypothetical protein